VPCPALPDIGFALLAQYYGNGYASEACEALMQYYRETKGFESFAGFTHPKNVASQKLFARLGFVNRGTRNVSGVVGDGTGADMGGWVKGVDPDVDLDEVV
jgi:RimJ/RimL family protein N-acetyltransferase